MSAVAGNPLAPPLGVALGASRFLAVLLIVGHVVVIGAVLASRPHWSTLILLPWPVWSLHRSLGRHAMRYSGHAAIRVDVDARGEVCILYRNGDRRRGAVRDSTTVHPWIVILNLDAVSRTPAQMIEPTGRRASSGSRTRTEASPEPTPRWRGMSVKDIRSFAKGRSLSFSVMAPRDGCDPGELRRLRAWLRWAARDGAQGDGPGS